MRSCFVPQCDILSKNITKRMMFIPPKNQELFNLWKTVLPNRRELRPTDRVCERHFNSDDIVKTFDHIINGVLHQIDRGKPKLRPTAVPTYNLPTDDSKDFIIKHETNEIHGKYKKQQGIAKGRLPDGPAKTRRPIIKRLNKDVEKKRTKNNVNVRNRYQELNEMSESIEDVTFLDDENSATDQHSNIEIQATEYELQDDTVDSESYLMKNNERTATQLTDELSYGCVDANLFDGIYEDIYEVTLPNTLWGLHRDPNRTFIVFSYFDEKTCSTSKLIRLDSGMNTQIHIKGKMVNKYRSNLSIEYLTNLVSQVDDYRICEKIDRNDKCQVVAVERNLCTVCQLNKG